METKAQDSVSETYEVKLHPITLKFPTEAQETEYMESRIGSMVNVVFMIVFARTVFNTLVLTPENFLPPEAHENEFLLDITWWVLAINTVIPLSFLSLVVFWAYTDKEKKGISARRWRIAILVAAPCHLASRSWGLGLAGQPLPSGILGVACSALLSRLHWLDHVAITLFAMGAYLAGTIMAPMETRLWTHYVETLAILPIAFTVSYFSDRKLRQSYHHRQCLNVFKTQLSGAEKKLTKKASAKHVHIPRQSVKSTAELACDTDEPHPLTDNPQMAKKKVRHGTGSSADLADVLHRATRVQDMLVAAEQRKSFFLATMSHELRTPLAALLGCADLLDDARGHLTDNENELLSLIHTSGDHLLAIVNDILDFSKLANSSSPFRLEPIVFDPHRLATQILATFSHQASGKGVELSMDTSGVPPTTTRLFGDRTRIIQVITNLVGNAIKFTAAEGSVIVRLLLRSLPDNDDTLDVDDSSVPKYSAPAILTIEVTDTGIGMSPEVISKLFQPFSQGQEGINRKYGGTGLGLSITSELVKLMGGPKVEVESEVGHGSTFRANLMIRTVPSMTTLTSPRSFRKRRCSSQMRSIRRVCSRVSNTVKPLADMRVLLVDDVRSIRLIGTRLLQQLGAVVEVAESGEKALAAVLEAHSHGDDHDFEAVLMDMHMPGMDGVQTTAAIIEATRGWARPPYIFGLTADVLEEAEAAFLCAGATAVLTKPVNKDRLRKTLLALSTNTDST
jgi:signal transduction histidine kinase/ActR/RegA family two-component response regulator